MFLYIIRCHSNSVHIFLLLRDHFTPEARVHSYNHFNFVVHCSRIKHFSSSLRRGGKKIWLLFYPRRELVFFVPEISLKISRAKESGIRVQMLNTHSIFRLSVQFIFTGNMKGFSLITKYFRSDNLEPHTRFYALIFNS